MKGRARRLAAAVVAAGVLHAVAGGRLAAGDPIAALLDQRHLAVVAAAVAVAAARLFLFVVAPAWAACFAATSLVRAIAAARARR